jgi:hypothetical protein
MASQPLEHQQPDFDVTAAKRSAVELLLDWGFKPAVIADQLGCSRSWISRIRSTRRRGQRSTGSQEFSRS